MSFFRKLQNALGFGGDEEIDDGLPEMPDTSESPVIRDTMPDLADADTTIEVSHDMMIRIFDKVVEVTNTAIPDYFKHSVDTERQKKFLFEALDSSVKEYLKALDEKSQAKCMAVWQKERDDLRSQMENLKQRAADLEAKRSEMNEQKLSSDRQRRALSDRVHDLEAAVMKLEAEKEQFEIENRGLINKAKVASVYEADIDSMRQELETLRRTASGEKAKEEMDKMNQEINYLKAENTKLSEACEAAKVKDEMSESMLNSLQKRASESQQNAKDLEKKIEQLEDDIALKEAQIADLMNQINEKNARIAENEQAFEEFDKIAAQLDAFENIKSKYEEKIQKLKTELASAQKDNESLKTTMKDDQNAHAMQQKAMKDQIEKLKSDPIAGEDFSFDNDTL